MRLIFILIFTIIGLLAFSQEPTYNTTINVGSGGSGSSGPADSVGIVIPKGEILQGTDSKAPYSTDSLKWDAGLYVNGPVNLTSLSAGVPDSTLYIDASGFVGKTGLFTDTNFGNTNITFTESRAHNLDGNLLTLNNASLSIRNVGSTAGLDMGSDFTYFTGSTVLTMNTSYAQIDAPIILLDAADIILDAPNIILEDPLTLSTWDSILVRHPTTGEIQARLASTIAGSDSLGRNGTAGQIVFETATKAGNSDAGLFWDNTNKWLGVGTGSPSSVLDIVGGTGVPAQITFTSDAGSWRFRSNHATGQFTIIDNTTLTTPFKIDQGAPTNTLYLSTAGNIGIGTASPATSAKLDISSTTGALLLPRMTTTQRDALTAVAGMIIYNTTTGVINAYEGAAWVDL